MKQVGFHNPNLVTATYVARHYRPRMRHTFIHKAWTGGDMPRRGICLADSPFGRKWRGIRHQLFLHWLAYFMNVWGFPCDRYTRRRAWNQANLDAWASIKHEA